MNLTLTAKLKIKPTSLQAMLFHKTLVQTLGSHKLVDQLTFTWFDYQKLPNSFVLQPFNSLLNHFIVLDWFIGILKMDYKHIFVFINTRRTSIRL